MKPLIRTFALLTAFALPGASFAQAAPDAAARYTESCAKCHSVERVQGLLAKRPAAERTAFLERFLTKHYPPPEAERAAMVAFLMRPAEAAKK